MFGKGDIAMMDLPPGWKVYDQTVAAEPVSTNRPILLQIVVAICIAWAVVSLTLLLLSSRGPTPPAPKSLTGEVAELLVDMLFYGPLVALLISSIEILKQKAWARRCLQIALLFHAVAFAIFIIEDWTRPIPSETMSWPFFCVTVALPAWMILYLQLSKKVKDFVHPLHGTDRIEV